MFSWMKGLAGSSAPSPDPSDLEKTPCQQIEAALRRVPAERTDGTGSSPTTAKRNVVLLGTGSFNPVHAGHLALFPAAKRHLEGHPSGFRVLGGFISPSHSSYVSRKMGCHHHGDGEDKWLFPRGDDLCEAAVNSCAQTADWVSVCRWEYDHEEWQPYLGGVVQRMQDYLDKAFPLAGIVVIYLCGGDLFGRGMERAEFPAIGVSRPGHEDRDLHGHLETVNKPDMRASPTTWKFYCQDPSVPVVSSTAIRAALQEGRPIDALATPAVARLVQGPGEVFVKWRRDLGLPDVHRVESSSSVGTEEGPAELVTASSRAAATEAAAPTSATIAGGGSGAGEGGDGRGGGAEGVGAIGHEETAKEHVKGYSVGGKSASSSNAAE